MLNFEGLWVKAHGISAGSEMLGLSFRVRRAALSLQIQSNELMFFRYALAKTTTSTMRAHA